MRNICLIVSSSLSRYIHLYSLLFLQVAEVYVLYIHWHSFECDKSRWESLYVGSYSTTSPREQRRFPFLRKDLHPLAKEVFINMQYMVMTVPEIYR
jgi:hypothetical protein